MQVLQRARGVENVEIELEDIVEAARQSRLVKNPYKTILQRKYRPQFLVACVFMIFQQFDVSPFACTDAIPFLSCMVKRPFKPCHAAQEQPHFSIACVFTIFQHFEVILLTLLVF